MSHSVHLSFKYQFTKPNPHMSCTCNISKLHWCGNLIVQSLFRNPAPKKPWPGPTGSCNLAFRRIQWIQHPASHKAQQCPCKNLHHIFTGQMKKSWLVTSRTFHKDGCFRAASRVDSRGGTLSGPTYDPVPRKCRPMETRWIRYLSSFLHIFCSLSSSLVFVTLGSAYASYRMHFHFLVNPKFTEYTLNRQGMTRLSGNLDTWSQYLHLQRLWGDKNPSLRWSLQWNITPFGFLHLAGFPLRWFFGWNFSHSWNII